MNLIVGVERKILPRQQAQRQIVRMLRFLQEKAESYDGVFPHWIDGETGKTIIFGGIPGGDVVETALLMQGVLTVREYFDGDNALDQEIRQRSNALWRSVRWDRLVDDQQRLYWHWPSKDLKQPMRIHGSNEGHIAYLLAAASPTHSVPADVYHQGWVDSHRIVNQEFYGINLEVGRPHGVPLFWTHYSYLGLDPRGLGDKHVQDYFLYHRNVALVHRKYAAANPSKLAGYSKLRWGQTASLGPDGYSAWTPVRNDNGTIAPTAAISSMPYVPEQSIAMLEDLYANRGADLWGAFGFFDAFNDSRKWVAKDSWIGIDVGTIAPMIENHRSGLCWRLFTNAPEIQAAIQKLGIRRPTAYNHPAHPSRDREVPQAEPRGAKTDARPTLLAKRAELIIDDNGSRYRGNKSAHRESAHGESAHEQDDNIKIGASAGKWRRSNTDKNIWRSTWEPGSGHIPVISYRGIDATNLIVEVTFRFGERTEPWHHQCFRIAADRRPDITGHIVSAWANSNFDFIETGFLLQHIRKTQQKVIIEDLLLDKQPLHLQPNTWYTATLEIVDDEALFRLGDHVAYAKTKQINAPKNLVSLTLGTTWHEIKRVRIWHATQNPQWASSQADILKSRQPFAPTDHNYQQ